jgi:4-hydroxy-3-methylbut-2-enyl diphosphate reductase
MEILLANPRGFCAGVDRAIEIVERALELFEPPIYVRHEIVHNRYVVEGLRARGAVFVDELDDVPDGATLEVTRYARDGLDVVLIGHRNHPEVDGTLGQFTGPAEAIHVVESPADVATLQPRDPRALAFVTQTTLSMDDTRAIVEALQERFPDIRGPKKADICYATQNRQDAVKQLTARCDLMLVVGSPNSSNSNRLREIATALGVEAHLIDDPDGLDPAWVEGKRRVGVTAGASAPEVLVEGVIEKLRALGGTAANEVDGRAEEVIFPLPQALRNATAWD